MVGQSEGQIPSWLNSGIRIPGTEEILEIPLGHSQFTWYIWGPEVNAQIAFYLGTEGAGFFPVTTERPTWTGLNSLYGVTATNDQGFEFGKKVLQGAQLYYQRVKKDGKGLNNDGYGLLGVCNDSTAFLEKFTTGFVSVYPLVRSKDLKPQGDELDAVFADLPSDSGLPPEHAQSQEYQDDAACRILFMAPYAANSPFVVDERLATQMQKLHEAAWNKCLKKLPR